MSEITTVGLDRAKNVFKVHCADARGGVVFRKKLRRSAVLEFFSKLPPCLVAMEACGGGAHFWGRELARLGHNIRLIPPAYVKPLSSGNRTMRLTRRRYAKLRRDRTCASCP